MKKVIRNGAPIDDPKIQYLFHRSSWTIGQERSRKIVNGYSAIYMILDSMDSSLKSFHASTLDHNPTTSLCHKSPID